MNKLMILFSVIVAGLFLVSCAPAEKPIVCDPPYILVGNECCLDENNNGICDVDEAPEIPAPAPVPAPVVEEAPMEEMEEMEEEAEEEMPMMEEEAAAEMEEEIEEVPEGETELDMFLRTAEKTYGEPFERGSTPADQPPQFLMDIAAKDRYGFELGNRIRRWWVGFDAIPSIELYGTIAMKDGEQVILPVKPTSNLIFKNSEQCIGNPNCADVPFAYQWDKGEVTFLYCPTNWDICKQAKIRFIDRYS
ncbi:hypothetical protein GF371_03285 [Candidatus Woesearchaeota archaeon]|nr:hypothetical protein [Candidatus Woesearchaeota archaeon]